MLREAGYVSIASTRDPHEVCERYRKHRYSLILLDLLMPGLDGFQVMEGLKEIETDGYLPVLAITVQPLHKVRALKAGAKDFISKPFDLAEVLMRVHNMIEVRLLHLETKRLYDQIVAEQKVSEQLLLVFRSGPLAVSINTVAGGRIIDANEEHCRFFGYSREEMVGKSVMELNLWANPEEREPVMQRLLKQGSMRGFETKRRRRSGEVRDILACLQLIELARESEPVLISMFTDITERKQAEEQLKASFKKVGDLNTEIQNFYHTLSHELKTPLTSAREFVSIVMDGLAGPLNETQLEYLGIAKESCDQLGLYINDLLDVTRLETGKMSIELKALPLAALVERVVEMLAPAAAGKGVSLSCECQEDLLDVPIDKQRILQVLTNLTTNAIKFTATGGHIRLTLIEALADPECLQIDVRDSGRGIPKDQLELIFNRRYQGNHDAESAESRNGLGLGLYICQELVTLHGGRIWVKSEIGKGSTFSFVVPKQARTKGAHVLIVDDDYGVRETLRLVLEDQGFEVTTAQGGSEGLRLLGQRIPDVVVLDLMMAGLDGPNTLKAIRMNWGLIPIILHTGHPDSNLMRRAMESSPFTLLAKPCPPKQFVETVRRMCHPHETRFLKKPRER
jgi:PAS domain S-box-containing protein